MIRVVVPYTPSGLRPETVAALAPHVAEVDLVNVSGDDEAYWRLWRRLWQLGDDLTVIEHDIVVNPDTIKSFDDCPEPWCAFAYHYAHFGLYPGTGCVRFRAELLAGASGTIEIVGAMFDQTHPQRHYCRIDAWMKNVLQEAGYRLHRHDPPVTHLGVGVAHGCC